MELLLQWLSNNWITIVGIIFIFSAFLTLWRWYRKKAKGHIYFVADTHFDHANIIRYCKRPFLNVRAMNRALVSNWNNVVRPEDTVYFLGDWAFGRHSRPPKYWERRLSGHIISIRGSHDKGKSRKSMILNYGGYKFLLLHNPDQMSRTWHGWLIHGHKHNNSMRRYPFVNGRTKTINVGVELIRYRPISLDSLLSLDIASIRRMETISSKPERW